MTEDHWADAIRYVSSSQGQPESEVEKLRRQLGNLESERDRLRGQLENSHHALSLLRAQLRVAQMAWPTTATSLEPALLKKLIRLCHPDKHDGSKLANEVTVELLKMRR